jgi:hypothetical protein
MLRFSPRSGKSPKSSTNAVIAGAPRCEDAVEKTPRKQSRRPVPVDEVAVREIARETRSIDQEDVQAGRGGPATSPSPPPHNGRRQQSRRTSPRAYDTALFA